MSKYDEKISDQSLWITTTPTSTALSLPFCVTEAGHFYAEADYEVQRISHDSFLFLYTIAGCGCIQSGEASVKLPANHAILIDCHQYHRYCSDNTSWEFIWLHLRGSAAPAFMELLYPNDIYSVNIHEPEKLSEQITDILHMLGTYDILNSVELSAKLHDTFTLLVRSSLKNEQAKNKGRYDDFVKQTAELIHSHYDEPLTIDDMIADIPMSKYHFIRTFKRIMGATPYHYLTAYRINNAKILLRTTDMTVAQIAECCGFLDASNFIAQFKKNTNQKPLQYRHYFSSN